MLDAWDIKRVTGAARYQCQSCGAHVLISRHSAYACGCCAGIDLVYLQTEAIAGTAGSAFDAAFGRPDPAPAPASPVPVPRPGRGLDDREVVRMLNAMTGTPCGLEDLAVAAGCGADDAAIHLAVLVKAGFAAPGGDASWTITHRGRTVRAGLQVR